MREQFISHATEICLSAIKNIASVQLPDIYAISFLNYPEEDDPRYSKITIGYNTFDHFTKMTPRASSEMEAKWNYAFWLQNEMGVLGGMDDTILKRWFEQSEFFYSEEVLSQSDTNLDLFDETLELGEGFENEFTEIVIQIAQSLFANNHIHSIFGKNIPIIIHGLEYGEKPASWTARANPKGLADEFIRVMRLEY